ncbi:MAG: zinc ribbon domain-containing protein [Gemmatimonadota bacterium]|nr:zinc ribbon domain-containing protein [Gemmatimonadota bacterium]
MTAVTCPSCGSAATGKFCRQCGTTLTSSASPCCGRCGAPPAAGARFCAQCGASASATAPGVGRTERLTWFLAGGGVVALAGALALLLGQDRPPTVADAAGAVNAPFASGASAADGTPPDISNMSPRERFDRLFNRIMRAAESGDEATVTTFAPMALSAFQMLDSVNVDARYHAALIQLHTGDMAGAAAQGDSILKAQPGHLFGYIVKGTIARFQKDQAALGVAYTAFLKHYAAEAALKRPEYAEHPRAVEDFLTAARTAEGGSGQ